jgi:hypothetical protein
MLAAIHPLPLTQTHNPRNSTEAKLHVLQASVSFVGRALKLNTHTPQPLWHNTMVQ